MALIKQIMDDSLAACRQWSLTDYAFRANLFTALITQPHSSKLTMSTKKAAQFCLAQTDQALKHTHQLTGATGESNELYCVGRGVVALYVLRQWMQESDDTFESKIQAVEVMVLMAILTGNSVILCCDDESLIEALTALVDYFPIHILQFVTEDNIESLIASPISLCAYMGPHKTLVSLNQLVANRNGPILPLVAQTNFKDLDTIQDPFLYTRFITERTRTVNLTAVGGNATLLEMNHG